MHECCSESEINQNKCDEWHSSVSPIRIACQHDTKRVDGESEKRHGSISPIFLATIDNDNLADKVRKIKLKCEVWRKYAEAKRKAHGEVENMCAQMMDGNEYEKSDDGHRWQLMPSAIDSGRNQLLSRIPW